MDIVTLLSEHDRIDRLAVRLGEAASAVPHDLDAVIAAGNALADTLEPHVDEEQRDLYPRLIDEGDVATSRMARELTDALNPIVARWSIYRREWTPGQIGTDWMGFRRDTIAMINILRERVRRENEMLLLGLRGAHLPLRAA